MRYQDIICSACGNAFTEDDDVVVCPVCGTPHHRACWTAQQHCANEALHDQGFEWQFPEDKDPLKQLEEQKRAARSPAPSFQFKNGEKVVECPRCGSPNYENDAYCLKCHAPLKENTDLIPDGTRRPDPAVETDYYNDHQRLVYDNHRLYGGLDPNTAIDGIPVSEYSDFIGGKAPGKTIRRIANMERFDRKISFNIAAFIFGPLWLFYRKMYKAGAMFLVVMTLCAAISGVLITTPSVVQAYKNMFDAVGQVYAGEITAEEYYEKLFEDVDVAADTDPVSRVRVICGEVMRYVSQIVWFSCGFLGDRLYRKKCRQEIENARRSCTNMDDYRRMLFEKGGTSAAGAVIGAAAAFAALLLSQLPTYILVFTT